MGQVFRDNHARPEPTSNADQSVSSELLRVIDARWGDTFRNGGEAAFETFVRVYRQHFSRRDKKVANQFVQFFAKSIPPEQSYLLKTHPMVRYFFLDVRDFYRIKQARWNNLPQWKKLLTRRPSIHKIDLNAELKALEHGETTRSSAREKSILNAVTILQRPLSRFSR